MPKKHFLSPPTVSLDSDPSLMCAGTLSVLPTGQPEAGMLPAGFSVDRVANKVCRVHASAWCMHTGGACATSWRRHGDGARAWSQYKQMGARAGCPLPGFSVDAVAAAFLISHHIWCLFHTCGHTLDSDSFLWPSCLSLL